MVLGYHIIIIIKPGNLKTRITITNQKLKPKSPTIFEHHIPISRYY